MLHPSALLQLRLAPCAGKSPWVHSPGPWHASHPARCSSQGWVPLPCVVHGPVVHGPVLYGPALSPGAHGSRFSPSRKKSAAAGTSPHVQPIGWVGSSLRRVVVKTPKQPGTPVPVATAWGQGACLAVLCSGCAPQGHPARHEPPRLLFCCVVVRGLKEGNAPCETVCLHLFFFTAHHCPIPRQPNCCTSQ